ncbi:CU044_2847 family protein [Actinomycetospora lutea]|uniref:CU044_2847 family protein n=1 Tax=Actinomycetospora lutea TaxID=663604 RepID=UPI002365C670|nr:CU044_2847 family protein [Actinomycetospora lutea]MDD7942911.1 CU044_2847 family protein [Actinomycetospora lutea]
MTRYLEFPIDQNDSVLVEVTPATPGSVTRGGRYEDEVTRSGVRLEALLGQIGPAVNGVVTQLRSSVSSPRTIEIEFSVKIRADAKIVIASAGSEANFRVLVRWEPERP